MKGNNRYLSASLIFISILVTNVAYSSLNTQISITSNGSLHYSVTGYLNSVHTSRGILGERDGYYNRSHTLYSRMQLSAEINNTANQPSDILIPSGGYYIGPGQMRITNNAWSEGGINFENLKRNLAYCWDNGYLPILALWITNIDPLEERMYAMSNTEDIPPQPIANFTGYVKFLTWLKEWMYDNGYSNRYLIWEPCWEFNLYPWTNWGGAGTGRYWSLEPTSYETAMTVIKNAKQQVDFPNIVIAAHIVSWSSEEWNARGKPRINGSSGGANTIGYMNGMELCDLWGISLYGEWDIATDNDVKAMGTRGYVDWLFEKIIKQCAEDPDLGDTFIGTFEYNMPLEFYELRDDLINYTKGEIDLMAIDFINYSYSKIPQYYGEMRMLGWWCPFDSDAQWEAFRVMAKEYDGWR
ncbi:hypothetical protein MCGE09_00067 [Thaumarchaeota archaeon SCGC AB-539-E09]|nr:hypothetical protein MCGE09_00067 [Thaumarchaeota archaeon SCGC AB-539-E09]